MATLDTDIPMVPAGEASGSSAPSSSTKKPKRFEIKKWSAVSLWAWDIVVDNCAICRNHIMDLCVSSAKPTKPVLPVRNKLLRGGSATMHFTSIASVDGSRLVKCVHWIIVSGSSKSMAIRERLGRPYLLNPLHISSAFMFDSTTVALIF